MKFETLFDFVVEYFYESDESTSDDEYASSSDISGNSREGAMYENNDYSIDDEYTGEEWDPPKKNKCEGKRSFYGKLCFMDTDRKLFND